MLLFFNKDVIKILAEPIFSSPIEDPIIRTIYMFFIFLLANISEYGVFNYNSGKEKVRNKGLFRTCLKVNLITFPLTYLLSYIIFLYLNSYFLFYFILMGVAVLPVEYFLLKREFARKFNEMYLPENFLKKFAKANFISFLIGALAFIPIFPGLGTID